MVYGDVECIKQIQKFNVRCSRAGLTQDSPTTAARLRTASATAGCLESKMRNGLVASRSRLSWSRRSEQWREVVHERLTDTSGLVSGISK